MVKSGNSCEDMLAVGGRLLLERGAAEREVRISGKGKSESKGVEGRGWLLRGKKGMMTESRAPVGG